MKPEQQKKQAFGSKLCYHQWLHNSTGSHNVCAACGIHEFYHFASGRFTRKPAEECEVCLQKKAK